MKRVALVIVFSLLFSGALLAQDGAVTGTVTDEDGAALQGVRVVLHGEHHGGGHGGMMDSQAWTDETGGYLVDGVAPGTYEARAMLFGYEMEEQEISVQSGETVTVDFVLAANDSGGGGGHEGGHWRHQWEEVTLHGWTIVEAEDDEHPMMDFYYLDEDNDGVAEYRLGFGPPWYEPESGAQRPEQGDEIDVAGALVSMSGMGGMHWEDDQPLVMVWELNGETWFEPDTSGHHGGHGGGWHDGHGCSFEEPEIAAAEGYVIEDDLGGMHDLLWLDTDDDGGIDFRLDFGAPDYDPGNGAVRPEDGDWVEVLGGLIEGCPIAPTIVVYELNGMFWREPGDTTGLGPATTSVGDEIEVRVLPVEHIVVKAYPNPFNPSTTLKVALPEAGNVRVTVYDVIGRQVAVVYDGAASAGENTFPVNGGNWSSGVYFVRVESSAGTAATAIQLMK